MTETNLQKSETVIARILDFLLELGLQDGSSLAFEDLDIPDDHHDIFNGCCIWLLEEGIIRCTNHSQANIGGVMLFNPMITSNGFALLDKPLVIRDQKISVGQAVKEIARGNRNYAGIGDFFGGFLGGFTKSMGS